MVTNICQRATSGIQNMDTAQKTIVAGVTGLSLFFFGIPTAIVTLTALGGTFAYMNSGNPPPQQSVFKEPPAPPERPSFDREEKENRPLDIVYERDERTLLGNSVVLHHDALVAVSAAKPPEVQWKTNSCYIHSPYQVILSEPIFLDELPLSIGKRLVEKQMFDRPINAILEGNLSEKQRDALVNLGFAIARKPMTQNDILNASKALHALEDAGFPAGTRPKIKSLISLLELYDLVIRAQRGEIISGEQINSLRRSLHRVDPLKFAAFGTDMGDPYEVLKTFADLILKGSRHDQNQTTNFVVNPVPYGRPMDADERGIVRSIEPNWGCFELHVPKGSLVSSLEGRLRSKEKYEALYFTVDSPHAKIPFTVSETYSELQFAPELLMLKNASKQPIKVDQDMVVSFGRGGRATYRLSAVVTHHGMHCTAAVKKPNGACYYLDDLRKTRTPIAESDLKRTAEDIGYVFFFRKIRDN